jgi:hypothetical protein
MRNASFDIVLILMANTNFNTLPWVILKLIHQTHPTHLTQGHTEAKEHPRQTDTAIL